MFLPIFPVEKIGNKAGVLLKCADVGRQHNISQQK